MPEDGLRRVFVFVGDDAGARATNLLQAAPVRRGAGKSGQSPKGSQGRSKLLRWEGGLGWHRLISRGISEGPRHGEGGLNPGEPGRVARRRTSGISTAPGGRVLAPTAGPMPGDRGELMELGGMGFCGGFSVLPPTVE